MDFNPYELYTQTYTQKYSCLKPSFHMVVNVSRLCRKCRRDTLYFIKFAIQNTITIKHKQNNRWRGDLMKPLGLSSEVASRNKQYMYMH